LFGGREIAEQSYKRLGKGIGELGVLGGAASFRGQSFQHQRSIAILKADSGQLEMVEAKACDNGHEKRLGGADFGGGSLDPAQVSFLDDVLGLDFVAQHAPGQLH
jgi:hypothetical protein